MIEIPDDVEISDFRGYLSESKKTKIEKIFKYFMESYVEDISPSTAKKFIEDEGTPYASPIGIRNEVVWNIIDDALDSYIECDSLDRDDVFDYLANIFYWYIVKGIKKLILEKQQKNSLKAHSHKAPTKKCKPALRRLENSVRKMW